MSRNIRVAENDGACDQGISTDNCEKVDRLAKGRAALCGSLAELRAENKPEESVDWQLDEREEAGGRIKSGDEGWETKNEIEEKPQKKFKQVW